MDKLNKLLGELQEFKEMLQGDTEILADGQTKQYAENVLSDFTELIDKYK